MVKGDHEVGSQYFVNVALKALNFVDDLTESDEKLQKTIMFLTKDYIQSKPSTSDIQTAETADGVGRYSDISSKNPSIKAPRKHFEGIKVGMGHSPSKSLLFKAPWEPMQEKT
jgi:hypothetical protein